MVPSSDAPSLFACRCQLASPDSQAEKTRWQDDVVGVLHGRVSVEPRRALTSAPPVHVTAHRASIATAAVRSGSGFPLMSERAAPRGANVGVRESQPSSAIARQGAEGGEVEGRLGLPPPREVGSYPGAPAAFAGESWGSVRGGGVHACGLAAVPCGGEGQEMVVGRTCGADRGVLGTGPRHRGRGAPY